MATLKYRVQQLRGSSELWGDYETPLKEAEFGYNTDTKEIKIGDGTTLFENLVPLAKSHATTAELDILDGATVTTAELNKLHGMTATKTELDRVHGVTSAIQTQLDSKFAKSNIQTAFGETLSDEKAPSEKLTKNMLDTKQNTIATDNRILFASVLSSMNIIGENNDGRVYNEPKTFAKLEKVAHSTFDSTKFTIAGSPNISTTGIASDFTGSNRIYKTFDYSGESIEITVGYYYEVDSDGGNIFYVSNSSGVPLFRFYQTTNITFYGVSGENLTFTTTELNLSTNDFIIVKGKKNTDNTLTATVINTNKNIIISKTTTGTIANSISATGNKLYIGNSNGNERYIGEIDLKYTNIRIDDVSIFSGNTTGIDTIKPDNFSVVGNPIISEDRVASGFLSNNYIEFTSNITSLNSAFMAHIIFTTPTDQLTTNGNIFAIMGSNYRNWTRLIFQADKKLRFSTSVEGTSVNVTSAAAMELATTYEAECGQNKDGSMFLRYRILGEETWTSVTGTNTLINIPAVTKARLGQAPHSTNEAFLNGKIDLNSFRFYVSDLKYQPCLRIPYIYTSSDKKFADIYYNDRVKDMAEQFGAAPYTVIDESNRAFILPYGSVDSKVAPKILVDSYYDGATSWEQYLDRTMIQRGTMTANTAVTFPCSDEYADTDFSLSCPYSAKSKTGFTPTVSGEYIAIGKF